MADMPPTLRADFRRLVLMGLLILAPAAQAVDVNFKLVSDGVYAYVGDKSPRTHDNEGLNTNIGLIVTPARAVLIDSGATYQSARKIHDAVRRVTPQPIQWVINTGGQDHRWLGNGYFKEQGAEIIAHASARADMLARGGDHLAGLTTVLKERADRTVSTLATRFIDGNDAQLELGGITLELRHRGGGHTPGDMMVWRPSRHVLFSGDMVYADHVLGVTPESNNWSVSSPLLQAAG